MLVCVYLFFIQVIFSVVLGIYYYKRPTAFFKGAQGVKDTMPIGKKRPGKIYMPGDLGDPITRRLYKKPGPVITYKLEEECKRMDEILPLQEFLKLPVDRAREIMLDLSQNISDQQLATKWSTQVSYVRKLRFVLGIQKDHSGKVTSLSEARCEKWPPVRRFRSRQQTGRKETKEDKAFPRPRVRGFSFSLDGVFNGEEVGKRLDAIKTFVVGSGEKKYVLSIALEEVVSGINQDLENSSNEVPLIGNAEES